MPGRFASLLTCIKEVEAGDPYASEVQERFPDARQQSLDTLAREVASEVALSLGRAGSKVTGAIARLHELDRQIRAAPNDPDLRRHLATAYNEQRRRAQAYLRDLRIQREALGFLRHDDLNAKYPLPAAKSID